MGLAALALGAFWHGWNLVAGEIPVLTSVTWLTERTGDNGMILRPAKIFTLPLGLSRSWDMLGAALFVWLVCRFWRRTETSAKKDDLLVGLVGGLVGGLVFGLVFGLVVGLGVGLGYSFVIGLFWLGLLPGLAVFFIITAPLWLIAGGVAAHRAAQNRSPADWTGVKQLLTGVSGNGRTEC